MADDLVVDFGITGVQDLVAGWKQIADSASTIVSPMRSFTRSLGLAEERSGRLAMNMMVIAGAAQALGRFSAPNVPGRNGGAAAIRPISQAQGIRQQAQMLNAQAALIRAQNNFGNATNPGGAARNKQAQSFGQALKNAISSTRFTANNGHIHFQPLIGRMMQVVSQAGPLGQAFAVLTAEVTLLAHWTGEAAKMLREFRDVQLQSGGTAQETAQARAIAGNLGRDPNQIAADAAAFSRNIGQPGYAAAFAAQHGIYNPAGSTPLGADDQMNLFLDALKQLRKGTDAQARQFARAEGLEGYLGVRNMPDRQFQQIQAEARLRGQMFGGPSRQAQEFATNLHEIGQLFSDIKDTIGTIGMLGINKIFRSFHDFIDGTFDLVFGKGAAKKARELAANDNHDKAMDRHAEAMRQHAYALKEGAYGGGERMRAATQFRHDRTGRQAAVNLGAFSF